MALQHAPGTLPGAEDLLADCPAGSIGATLTRFHVEFAELQTITSRRAYERSLVLLLKDLAEAGPAPSAPLADLTGDRLVAHLDWRVANGLGSSAEFVRAGVHLGHLAEWLAQECDTDLGQTKLTLRAAAADRATD
jgi:hypothetical protein